MRRNLRGMIILYGLLLFGAFLFVYGTAIELVDEFYDAIMDMAIDFHEVYFRYVESKRH